MSETTEHQIYACWCGHRPIRHPRRGDVIVCLECEAAHPAEQYLEALREHGYVIVHPDDVPEHSHGVTPPSQVHSFNWVEGWNACRRHIFAEQETP